MNRIELIQEIFQKSNLHSYVEIGCERGHSFLPIRAKYKIAVDPFLQISVVEKAKWIIRNPANFRNKYFEEESDLFFSRRKTFLKEFGPLDVVLVDGLHTFRASLNDVLNSLLYLNTYGVIILHDCYPPHKPSAAPFKHYPTIQEQSRIEGWTGEWCGEVWKTIVFLRKNMDEYLDVCVINTDYGLGIIRPKKRIDHKGLIVDESKFLETGKLTYEELMEDPGSLLGLKDTDHLSGIIQAITSSKKSSKSQ